MKFGSWLDKRMRFLFLVPALLLLILLLGFPILSSIYYSLTNKSLIYPDTSFIGLQNYRELLRDKDILNALLNSVKFTFLIVLSQLVLGMVAALSLNHIKRFQGLFRTMLIVPWTFPNIVMTFTWTWLFNDLYGPVNAVLMKMGIVEKPLLFFASPALAVFSIVLITTWFGFPFMMVNILAGLQAIDQYEYEAAYMDGAGSIQSFFYITLPHLKVVLALIASLRIIWVFNNFDLIFLLTGGGPGNSTETLPLIAYRTGWGLNSLGKASAIAIILVLFLLIGITIYFHILRKRESDDT